MGSNDAAANVQKTHDKVLFEASCKVNFKRHFLFQLYIFKKKLLILLVSVLILNIIACISKPSVFIFVLTLVYCASPFLIAAYSALNEVLSCEDVPDKYAFYQDRLENKDFKGNNTVYYNEISIAYETENYFYIHAGKRSWCIIDKDKITGGNPDDMRTFLKEQLGSRFSINKKKGR
ncbi:MAG: YcxB family protein [Oscillospiraceae bacterium]|nr:YcxB family protein [Oscillospiraceae bacterium]